MPVEADPLGRETEALFALASAARLSSGAPCTRMSAVSWWVEWPQRLLHDLQ
jgi:hypothetical protein